MSTSSLPSLTEEIRLVTDNLKARGWIQGALEDDGKVCAHGAVMTCQGLRPGDQWIIRAVMRTKGMTEGWNDQDGRTEQEVVDRLSRTSVTDDDLAETFGPSWRLVIAVIRRAAVLSADDFERLAAAWDAARAAAWDAARDAARAAACMDLVGQHGLTQAHIDTLMAPWVTALGADWFEQVNA